MRGLGLAFCILLSGCAGPVVLQDATPGTPEATWLEAALSAQGCQSTSVFFLEDYRVADPWLPPGFQVRDLSDFLHYTPIIAGMVPAFLAVLHCAAMDPNGGPAQAAFMGFYVQPPYVPLMEERGEPMADHDFYVVRIFQADDVRHDLFRSHGWNSTQTGSSVSVTADDNVRVEQDILTGPIVPPSPLPPLTFYPPTEVQPAAASGSVGDTAWFTFDAVTAYPQAFPSPPLLRFWHATEDGLRFMEYAIPQQTVPAGQPVCHVQAGSPLHAMIGRGDEDPFSDECGALRSFALAFDDHDLEGRLVSMVDARVG